MSGRAARTAAQLLELADGTHRCALPDGRRAFVKIRSRAPAGFFAAEVSGLAALSAGPLRVPQVFAADAHGIVLEDLGSACPQSSGWQRAGSGLARLHHLRGASFGFDHPGWCGDSVQDNTPDVDGFRFFAERRLLPQARRGLDAGLLEGSDARQVESVCARLHEWLPLQPAVLVHGDLWLGNLHACADGQLALIDAGAVHYGWADADLAMLTLFGEPPAVFFQAYEEASSGDGSWRERAPLLNLYHLLNHLNLFGRGYLHAVRNVLARYA